MPRRKRSYPKSFPCLVGSGVATKAGLFHYTVKSTSRRGVVHQIAVQAATGRVHCTCEDFTHRKAAEKPTIYGGTVCKHVETYRAVLVREFELRFTTDPILRSYMERATDPNWLARRVIFRGEAHAFGEEPRTSAEFSKLQKQLGYSGGGWLITYPDGTTRITHNLGYNGMVPAEFRADYLPDNVASLRTLTDEEERSYWQARDGEAQDQVAA